jgi:hypothetical protein
MHRTVSALLAAGLAATWFGCQPATDSEIAQSPTGVSQPASPDDYTLVTLKVPNML